MVMAQDVLNEDGLKKLSQYLDINNTISERNVLLLQIQFLASISISLAQLVADSRKKIEPTSFSPTVSVEETDEELLKEVD